jgi:outer membrane protein assembly factor BamB
MHRTHVYLLAFILLVFIVSHADAQWSRFRGPNGSGIDSSVGYPVEFSQTKNLQWKTSVPYGQSSPIVIGNRLYGTASEGDRLITFCLDTNTGRELWRRDVRRERPQVSFKANDPASPTPAADANGVVAFFPDFGLVSYDNNGKQRWSYPLGPFKNFYGMAASPIIDGSTVALVCDQRAGSFVIALDRANGRLRWKADRPGVNIGWATPMVFRPEANRAELIVLGSTRLDGYDLASGAQRWWLPVGSSGALGTPLVQGDTLMISTLGTDEPFLPTFAAALSQYDKDGDSKLSLAEFRVIADLVEHFGWIDENDDKVIVSDEWNAARSLGLGEWGAIAVRPGKSRGQLEPSAVRWRIQKNIPYIPTPLLYQDVYYMVKTGGIITSIDPATGKILKEGRSSGALGEYYASPVAADGKVYLANTEGKITVLKAGAQWEVLAVNELGDEVNATPALSNGRLYVRTREAVHCFASR